ncbi:MAG: hypothetical protein ACREP9_18000 [Candidatus Dormibacteraceae bacterium]
MEQIGRVGRGVLVVGAALIGGFAAMMVTFLVIFVSGNTLAVLSQACSVSRPGRQVCPPNPWVWVFRCAVIVGAAAGIIWVSMFVRYRTRSPRPTIFD